MSYLFFAWLGAILYGLMVITSKLISKYTIANAYLFNFLYGISILLWTSPIALIHHAGIPHDWTNIIITGCLYALSGLFYIIAIYKLDISTISPLYNFQIAFAVILAGILLHENLGILQYVLVMIIFCAGLFTTVDEKFKIKSFFRWPVLIAICGALTYALSGIFTNKAVSQNDYWTAILWIPLISQCILCITFPLFKKEMRKISFKQLWPIVLIGMFDAMATLAAIKAYASNVAITAIIISLPISLILTVVISIFLPNVLEKHTMKVYAIRMTAALIMVAAALKLSF